MSEERSLDQSLTTDETRPAQAGPSLCGIAYVQAIRLMGGTGLEPVTPSLSSIFGGGDVPLGSPLFPAQEAFLLSPLWLAYANAVRIVCVFIVRRRTAPPASSVATAPGSVGGFRARGQDRRKAAANQLLSQTAECLPAQEGLDESAS